jgi:hypothetical protein
MSPLLDTDATDRLSELHVTDRPVRIFPSRSRVVALAVAL